MKNGDYVIFVDNVMYRFPTEKEMDEFLAERAEEVEYEVDEL